ncbi:hypothetical protein [Muribaculum intestinale]|uniref:hypothetical protein n=1 Tax=Muribaculum intestinale TaxID=1796646 RepID=UPI00105737C8|nr:hypothetical protein [Muribaculum intestinale]QQR08050.1 hypothetical protein I5Q90_08365 [Muribaculum intestinale]
MMTNHPLSSGLTAATHKAVAGCHRYLRSAPCTERAGISCGFHHHIIHDGTHLSDAPYRGESKILY